MPPHALPAGWSMTKMALHEFQAQIAEHLSRGDWATAGALASQCRIVCPSDASGWLLGSIAALLADQKEGALALIELRLAADPDNTQCLIQQAECLYALGRRDRAIAAAERAAAAAPDNAVALEAVCNFLTLAQEHRHALPIYDMAVAAAPADPAVLCHRALTHQYLGNFDLAAADFRRALERSPGYAEALKGLADLTRQSASDNHVAAIEAALAAGPADARAKATLHLALAKSSEDLGEYAKSWRHLNAANALERAALPYDPAEDRAQFDCIMAQFPNLESRREDSTHVSPIFIVGLPRTGTTLVERILGCHSAIHSAGELAAFAEAVSIAVVQAVPASTDSLGFTRTFGRLDERLIAHEYLARSLSRRGSRPRFIDKAPANFFHCALIFRAFPNARVIHLTRHPMAACYAIFKTRFNGGYPFSYDLEELGDFYIGYRRLMEHWHRILPGRILDVAYEDVVTVQESTTRRLLDYLGLPFEDACLNFHLNPAATSTSSSVQVRQPLYDSSLQQWRHYATELEPLRIRLEAAGISLKQDSASSLTATG